jgi:hypothetical protein
MSRVANIALLVAVALVAVVAGRMLSTPPFVEEVSASATVEGRVISVDAVSPDQRLRQAVVKLTTGETARASVPGSCLVFPGQIVTLAKLGEDGGSAYLVMGNGRDDS